MGVSYFWHIGKPVTVKELSCFFCPGLVFWDIVLIYLYVTGQDAPNYRLFFVLQFQGLIDTDASQVSALALKGYENGI